jgi:hypothetical protein
MPLTAPLIPLDERQRLLELRDFGILDTEPDEDYDRLVQLATVLCGTPMGTLTFVDASRQWHKSRVGVMALETPRDKAFCARAILDSDRLLEVPDAAQVPWFDPQLYGADGPAVACPTGSTSKRSSTARGQTRGSWRSCGSRPSARSIRPTASGWPTP